MPSEGLDPNVHGQYNHLDATETGWLQNKLVLDVDLRICISFGVENRTTLSSPLEPWAVDP